MVRPRRTPQFLLTAVDAPRGVEIVVAGRLVFGHGACWHHWAPLVPAAPALIRVDLGAVTEIDAAGIGVLLRLARTQQERGGDVEIVASSGRVQRLLRAARLNAALHVRGGEPRFDLAIRDLRRQLGARHP